jgi:DNA-binding response OmpR family regulator/NAD(P)-dependent dehydrogenase (short-subunit alcohol dehydrogenase family)
VAIDAPATCSALLVRISGSSPQTQSTLEEDGVWVTPCFDLAEAQQRTETVRPDLLIVELDGQRPGDWDACQQLSHVASQPLLVLVRDPSPHTRLAAFASGADDVLAQPFEPLELVARARALLRRGVVREPGPAILRHADLELDLDTHLARLGNQPLLLTPLEFRLLRVLLEHPQRAFSREELIARVHTFDNRLPSDRSIDLHVSELRAKLRDTSDAPRYIETLRGFGYRLPRVPAAPPRPADSAAQLAGKVAIVVGARGAGEQVARTLATAGASVVAMGSGPDVEPLALELCRDGANVRAAAIDVGNPVQLRAAIGQAQADLGSVDILVWAAGVALDVRLAELDDSTCDQVLGRGLGGALHAARELLPRMLDRGWGRIVIVTPLGGLAPQPGAAAACTVTHGLLGLTRALAAEVARSGVTVNAVCPTSGGAGYAAVGQAVRLLLTDGGTLSGQVLEVGV